MDIKIKTDEYDFKYRVAGCLLKDEAILTVQICNNGFYCFPGGHLHIGENTASAVKREFKEETELDCSVEKLLAVVENFFERKDGKLVHELCFFYLLSSENAVKKDFIRIENDENILKHLEFKWVELDKLNDFDFRPNILKEKLSKRDFNFEHIILDQTKK